MTDPASQFRNFITTQHHDTYPAIQKSCHQGHVVAITGASSGIGKATALSFARAGVSVLALIARRSLDEVESDIAMAAVAAGHQAPKVLKLVADVTDESSINAAAEETRCHHGRLDVLVNNAGRVETMSSLLDGDPQDWWRTFEVNIKGVYLTTRAFLPLLLAGGERTIINIGSMGAVSPIAGLSAYLSSKVALLQFSNVLTLEYGRYGLVSFTVYPGDVQTEVLGSFPDAVREYFVDTPELPADTISWLTQSRLEWLAGRFISSRWDMLELLNCQDDIVQGDKLKLQMTI
uniref:Short-chain dehydrogenase/reductase SptI n=1 Tax=Aspergillus sp. TaxID=5065 RepID=A0A6J4CWI8_9EURO|nr:short-chain dehydrogenase/reductase SptI [Aspergillus sp.]